MCVMGGAKAVFAQTVVEFATTRRLGRRSTSCFPSSLHPGSTSCGLIIGRLGSATRNRMLYVRDPSQRVSLCGWMLRVPIAGVLSTSVTDSPAFLSKTTTPHHRTFGFCGCDGGRVIGTKLLRVADLRIPQLSRPGAWTLACPVRGSRRVRAVFYLPMISGGARLFA